MSTEDRSTTAETQYSIEAYAGEQQLASIQALIDKDLSEPYSVFTYRYFLNQWPDLCFLARSRDGDVVGAVVCKLVRTGLLRLGSVSLRYSYTRQSRYMY